MTTIISGTTGISPSGLQSIVGQVSHFAMLNPPPGWVECNGAAVSRTTYSKLFSVIGTLYGAGDGSTTFNLPELRGEFIRGADRGRGVDSGRAVGSAQGDAIRNIKGSFDRGNSSILSDSLGNVSGPFFKDTAKNFSDIVGATGFSNVRPVGFDASLAVPTAAENRPRNVALLACIFTGV